MAVEEVSIDLTDSSTLIEAVVEHIVVKLELRSEAGFVEKGNVKGWVGKLQQNWIFNLGLLRKVDVGRLEKLELPLLLEEELERIILFDKEIPPDPMESFSPDESLKSETTEDTSPREKRPARRSKRRLRKSRVTSQMYSFSPEVEWDKPKSRSAKLHLMERQKVLIKASWEKLLKAKSGDEHTSAITLFFEEFYKRFFEVNPAGKRLFEQAGIPAQSRALLRMLSLVVKGIDNPSVITDTIHMLGGRHAIYGVENDDYVAFSHVLVDSFGKILGEDWDAETRNAWLTILQDMSIMMQEAGTQLKTQAFNGVCWRKLHRTGHWKKSLLVLTLDTLFIHRDEKDSKIRTTLPLMDASDIDMNEGRVADAPTDYGFILNLHDVKPPEIYFCFDSLKDLNFWVDHFTWRIQAIQRVYKEVEEPETSSPQEESTLKRKLHFFKKKRHHL